MSGIVDRQLRDLIDEILDASDQFDSVMNGVTLRLEEHERQAIWRAHEAMLKAAEYLTRQREGGSP
jgi:hypothetical protein